MSGPRWRVGLTPLCATRTQTALTDVALGGAGYFLNRCFSLQHFPPAVLPQCNHAFFQRLVADKRRVDTLHAQLADGLARNHELVDTHPAPEAGLATRPAAGALPQDQLATLVREVFGNLQGVVLVFHLALRADRP